MNLLQMKAQTIEQRIKSKLNSKHRGIAYAGSMLGMGTIVDTVFDPLSVAGCKLWLKADAGVTKDGGNLVSNWADQSGNSNDVAQATGTNQPLWVDSAYASKPTIRFDGVDNFMDRETFVGGALSQPNWIFLVTTAPTSAASNKYFIDGGGQNTQAIYLEITTTYYGITISGAALTSTTVSTSALQQLAAKFNSTTSKIRKNKTEIASGNAGSGTMNGITIGTEGLEGTTYCIAADICEILVYNADLSDTDRDSIENYLASRWGL